MSVLRIRGPARLHGTVRAPADKSVMHRALMLSAVAGAPVRVTPRPTGADNLATVAVLRSLGVRIEDLDGENAVLVWGVGHPQRFQSPPEPLSCENSGTTFRLMAGMLAASGLRVTLDGDASLRNRPMSRLLPLERMGARLVGREVEDRIYPPLTIEGASLRGVDHDLPIASAQVKSALLLAGLWASGKTRVREPHRSRDHTERFLRYLGVSLEESEAGVLSLAPLTEPWRPEELSVVPDLSSAAFLIAAAALTESTDVEVHTGLNPSRSGVLDALQQMGVTLEIRRTGDVGPEPSGTVRVTGTRLRGARIDGLLAVRSLDELPLLAAVAAVGQGVTEIRDAAELRVKESDRIESTRAMLEAFGAQVETFADGIRVRGGQPLRPGRVESRGDHRIALAAAVLALAVEGRSEVGGAEHIAVSFPEFAGILAQLGADVEETERES